MGFLPLGDDNSTRRHTPYVVWTLLAVNAAVWLLQLQRGEPFSNAWATVPLEIATGRDLVGVAEIRVQGHVVDIPHYPCPAPVHATLFTAMFMHGSWMHIIGNMLYLLIFADQIEDFLGRARFIAFYLACGVAAGLAQVWWNPESVVPCVGASGAIAGCLGAYLVKYPRNAVHVLFFRTVVDMPAWVVLGAWIVLQVFSQVGTAAGQATGVAYLAHIGGFVAGVVLVFLLGIGRKPLEQHPPRRRAGRVEW